MASPITICTVNYNTSRFIALMLYSFSVLTKNAWQMLICDNGSRAEELSALRELCTQYPNVTLHCRTQSRAGSIGHAEAMDFLVGMVDTPYFVTMDADCVFLYKHWDEELLQRLVPPVACIGTPPVPDAVKVQDFPNMFAVMYDTAVYRRLGSPSFMPDVAWVDMPDKTGVEPKDTGWSIHKAYAANGYRGATLRCINTRHTESAHYSMVCAEYFLPGSNALFGSHFGRGSTKGRAKITRFAPFWYRLPWLGEALVRWRCNREIEAWIQGSAGIIRQAAHS